MKNSAPHSCNNKLAIYGGGGHGHVVLDTAFESGIGVSFIIDEDPSIRDIHGVKVIKLEKFMSLLTAKWEFVVAIGDNKSRYNIFQRLCKMGGKPISVIHPSSVCSSKSYIQGGSVVFAGVIVNSDARVQSNVILNTGSTIDHHSKIGNHVHICPGVHIAGNVEVGDFSMIGTGASVIPNIKIGRNCIVGAGAAVVSDLPDYSVSMGVPAKVVRYQ